VRDIRFPPERDAVASSRVGLGRFKGPPSPDRRRWHVRPDDLLVFDVEPVNLDVVPGEGETAAHLERHGPGPALLVVTLPPQSVAEVAYFITAEEFPKESSEVDETKKERRTSTGNFATKPEPLDSPPIDARLAGWSRLAFIVPDEALPIEWTIPGILRALPELELNVAANARPPELPRTRFDPRIEHAIAPLVAASQDLLAAAAELGGASAEGAAALRDAVDRAVDVAFDGRMVRGPIGEGDSNRLTTVRTLARTQRSLRLEAHRLGLSEMSPAGSVVKGQGEASIGAISYLLRPIPGPPGDHQTAIELPWRLVLSPSKLGAWFHQESAIESRDTGHTELWHSRLGSRAHGDLVLDDPDRAVRAIWSVTPPGYPGPTTPVPGDDVAVDGADEPFVTSLSEWDRHNVVHLSSNYRLREADSQDWYEPQAVDVNFLALSALGGWLDSRGVWTEQPGGLNVEEWRHRATLGRDHYVRVVYAGRLFPFGHRVSLIKVTERRFESDLDGNPAYLRQRMFIVVREHERSYRTSGWRYHGSAGDPRNDERWDLKLPFTTIRILTNVSPILDDPLKTPAGQGAQSALPPFWPYVSGKPFCFKVEAVDVEEQTIDLAVPLIFVGQEVTDNNSRSALDGVDSSYRTKTWPGVTTLLATVPVGGQRIAYADADKPDDTTFATRFLTFAAERPVQAQYQQLPKRQPRYLPVVASAELDIPSLQKIAHTTTPAQLRYDDTYLHNAFEVGGGGQPGNAGQVFLARLEGSTALGVPFSKQSDRSGGLVAPDMELSGLSRVTGPVAGAVATAASGQMDPNSWFAGLLDQALLFGSIHLTDILDDVGFDALDALPRFVGASMDAVEKLVADLERLDTLLQANPVPTMGTAAALVDDLVHPGTGSVAKLFSGGSTADVVADLVALDTALDPIPAALAGSGLTLGPQAVIAEAIGSVRPAIASVVGNAAVLETYARGEFLPESLHARFEWRPHLAETSIFKPHGPAGQPHRNLILAVEASGPDATVTCSLDDFEINLEVLSLEFDRVQFRSRPGRKPEIDVAFDDFKFIGVLSFVETLRQLVPLDGLSDPPEVQVTAQGITAGFSMGLPNIAFGVFSLENLSLAAGFSVPFVGEPMSTWFRFCERENPSRLTVMMFGGGFFLGVTVNADGLQVAEGAIEFGAAISVNFGVASGSVSAMAGLYFKIDGDTNITLAGYFRLRGEVEALGIVSVCIELYLEMRYESGSNKCVGTATISIEIEVALFSTTIAISCTKKFAGSGQDPTLAQMFDVTPAATSEDWNLYCGAFAGAA
jgi:hypothetical protein